NLAILAVTILTSLDRIDLDAALIKNGDVKDLVAERAFKAFEAGADGVIASPQESMAIRSLPNAANKLIVTPGIRPLGTKFGDQKRVATPTEALLNGADHIVVGRPIVGSQNKKLAAAKILEELKHV
ncbi:MAG: orotidine-5'-phosphate decarboxylase, partial [Marinovum sp.]|nr:orotidine-5'-phosphate decarboxylase [Marinovum sp.]